MLANVSRYAGTVYISANTKGKPADVYATRKSRIGNHAPKRIHRIQTRSRTWVYSLGHLGPDCRSRLLYRNCSVLEILVCCHVRLGLAIIRKSQTRQTPGLTRSSERRRRGLPRNLSSTSCRLLSVTSSDSLSYTRVQEYDTPRRSA